MSNDTADEWQRLSRLLDEALELSTEERRAWLARLHEQSPELAARLAGLLDNQSVLAARQFMEGAAGSMLLDTAQAGQTIGQYTLESALGSGGTGSVWLARRSDGRFESSVAIKFLHLEALGGPAAHRFEMEGRLLATLAHPNIARLLDAGVTTGEQPYLVLEYVEGRPIDEYCDARRLNVDERVRLFLDVLAAVAHAHARLIVHRDIKPSNVYVTAEGVVKLLDFGIAKLLQPPQHADVGRRATREIGQALTPEFAAPEQLLGQPITTATDVYSLALVLYLLLAGRHPRGEGKTSGTQWVKSITEEPPRPSELATDTRHLTATGVASNAGNRSVSPSSLRRALRGDLDNILCKALKPEPEQRYATVTEFAADLRRYLRSDPVSARPDTIAYRAQKFARRNRGGVAAGILMLVALVGATVVTAVQMLEARRQRDAALYQQQRAEQVKDFVASIFADASPWSGSQDKPSAVELLTRARARVDDMQGFDAATRFELLGVIGESLQGLGATTEAAQTADNLVAQSTALLGEEHPLTLRGRSLRVRTLRGQGQTEAMRREVDAVLAVLRPRAEAQPEAAVKALNDLAELENDEARYDRAEQTAHQALRLAQRHRAKWQARNLERDQAALWKVIAVSRESRGSYGPAFEAAQRAYEHASTAYQDQPKHPFLVNTRLVFARIAAHSDVPRAIEMMQQSIADAVDVLGAGHQSVGTYSQNLAVWQARVGDLQAAQASIARALPIIEKQIGAETAHFAAGLDAAAYIALNSRQAQRALALYDRGHAILIKHFPEQSEHPTVFRMRRALARAYSGEPRPAVVELRAIVAAFAAGKYASPSRPYLALGEAQRLAGDFRAALASQHAGIALIADGPNAERERMSFLAEIGLAYLSLGEPARAVASLESALALIAKHQTHVTPLRADALVGLGRAQMALGKNVEAVKNLESANTFWRQFDSESRWHKEAALWLGRAHAALDPSTVQPTDR